jgi:hypothetical protein
MWVMSLETISSIVQDLRRNKISGRAFFYLTNKLKAIFDILQVSFAYQVSYLSINQVSTIVKPF